VVTTLSGAASKRQRKLEPVVTRRARDGSRMAETARRPGSRQPGRRSRCAIPKTCNLLEIIVGFSSSTGMDFL